MNGSGNRPGYYRRSCRRTPFSLPLRAESRSALLIELPNSKPGWWSDRRLTMPATGGPCLLLPDASLARWVCETKPAHTDACVNRSRHRGTSSSSLVSPADTRRALCCVFVGHAANARLISVLRKRCFATMAEVQVAVPHIVGHPSHQAISCALSAPQSLAE
jgi:hypothetical protein